MTATRKIEAVTFDAAGTLFFPKPSVGAIYQEILANNGVVLETPALEQAFHKAFKTTFKDRAFKDSEEREWHYWKEIVRKSICSLSSIPKTFDSIFEQLWSEFAKGSRWKLNADAEVVFKYLEDRHINFALLTNWDSRVRSVLDDHNLENRFTRVFVSSEIGCEKPDSRIFEFAADSLRVNAERILHVGDHLAQDVAGAENAGWTAVHYNPKAAGTPGHHHSVRRLLDLVTLIDSKNQ